MKPFTSLPLKVFLSLLSVIAAFVIMAFLAPKQAFLLVFILAIITACGGVVVAVQAVKRRRTDEERLVSWGGAQSLGPMMTALVFSTAFIILITFASPGMYFRDGGELASAAYVLGVPHPTGFPIFCLFTKAFDLLPIGSVFFRSNMASVAMMAFTTASAFVVIWRLTEARVVYCALAAPLILLESHVAWLHGTTTEVYAISSAGLALTILAFIIAAKQKDLRALVIGWMLLGLGAGAHITWPLEGAVAGVIATATTWNSMSGKRLQILGAAALFALLGKAIVAYLPVAAARDPIMNWGDPSSWSAFIGHLTGKRIRESFSVIGEFRWPVLYAHAALVGRTLFEGTGVLWLIAVLGVILIRPLVVSIIFISVAITDVAFAIFINPMGVWDLQTGLPFAFVIAVLAGSGLVKACVYAQKKRNLLYGIFSMGVLFIGVQWAISPAERDMTRLNAPAAIAYDALNRAPVAAVMFTTSDDLSAGLLGIQAVEGARPDILVLVKQHLSDSRFIRRMIRAHWTGKADERFLDELKRQPFEYGETPSEALARAIQLASMRGPVLMEPGEGWVDREILRKMQPDFPLFRMGAGEPVRDTTSALGRLLAYVSSSDRFGREYLGRYAGLLGAYLAMAGHEMHAIGVLRRALEIEPNNSRAMHNLALLLSAGGLQEEALGLLKRAVEIDPIYVRGWRTLAKVAASMGLSEEAEEANRRAVELE